MNPDLNRLQPYPFQKLAALFREVAPNQDYRAISLSIGEPKHATPQFIKDALTANLDGLANYPTTAGSDALRNAIADWLAKRVRLSLPAGDAPPIPDSPQPPPGLFLLRSIPVCATANSASRLPFTGNPWVFASGSGMP